MYKEISRLQKLLDEKNLEKRELEKEIKDIEGKIEVLKANFLSEQIKKGENKDLYAICVDTSNEFRVCVSAVIINADGQLIRCGKEIENEVYKQTREVTEFKNKILELKEKYNSSIVLMNNDYTNKFTVLYELFDSVYPYFGGYPMKKRYIRGIVVRRNKKSHKTDDGYIIAVEEMLIRGSCDNPVFEMTTKRVKKIFSKTVLFRNKPANMSLDRYIGNALIDVRDDFGYLPIFVNDWDANNKERHFDLDFTVGNSNNRIHTSNATELENYISENELDY